jgi:hypothetical protein
LGATQPCATGLFLHKELIFERRLWHLRLPYLLGLSIEPRPYNDRQQAELWARDRNNYHLTAVLKGASITDDLLFNLEAILSFVEHLTVLITSPEEQINEDPFAQFSLSLTMLRRCSGGGAVIGQDTFYPDSRRSFVSKTLDRLQDPQFCEETQFRDLFFKCVEAFRQPRPFVEVTYFFLYSGLESHARSVTKDKISSASIPIFKLLTNYGFDVHQEITGPNDNFHTAVATYTHLRNALFHNSMFTAKPKINGVELELKLFDYLDNFQQLVPLVILKAVGYDGYVNWERWINMQN